MTKEEIIKKLLKWKDECNPKNGIGYGIRMKIDEILKDEI